MEHQLVMITSSGPGAGSTTLAGHLQSHLGERGHTVRLWPEMALFEWESLASLADGFRRREYPGPDELISVLTQVLGSAEREEIWILDWTWIDLAEDLPWAVESRSRLDEFSRQAYAATAHLWPLVLYLHSDIAVALDRAVKQRGQRWLEARGSFDELVSDYTAREPRIRRALAAGGWPTAEIRVQSHANRVLTEALAALEAKPAT